jgi:hypothetical protein
MMSSDALDLEVLPIDFGRSLVWATGVTLLSAALFSAAPAWWSPHTLSGCFTVALLGYPLIACERRRSAFGLATLAVLLLLPIFVSPRSPVVASVAAAAAIGLLRSWQYSKHPGSLDLQVARECTCIGASLGMTLWQIGPSGVDQVFAVWGFCLGQVVSSLFGEKVGTAPPISVGR